MNRITLLPLASLLLLAFGSGTASAERRIVALGLAGGVTSTSYYGEDAHDFDFEIWPTAGFTLAFHLPAFLGVEMDLLYVGKSGSQRQDAVDTLGEPHKLISTFKLHALEIPFLIKITAPTESEVQPIFFGGPSLAWFLSKKSTSEFIDFSESGMVSADEQEPIVPQGNLRDYEWSVCVGAGVEWGLGSFQLRANLAQQSLDKSGSVDLRTFNLALMAGFLF